MRIKLTIIGAGLLLASAIQSFAIEGLKLSLQCSNVVLCWPSVAGDAYFIRYRPDLTTNSSWTILTNAYPAANGTNMTYFVHANVVLNPNCGGGGSGGSTNPPPSSPPPKPSSTQSSTLSTSSTTTQPHSPPPEAPLPWDPKWQAHGNSAAGSSSPSGFAGPNNSQTGQCGFYEVVKVGVHLFGITNGMVLSGTVPLKFEFANGSPGALLNSISVVQTNSLSLAGGEWLDGANFPNIPGGVSNLLCGTWDTTRASNGVYAIQAAASLNDGTFYLDHPVSVTVSNPISWIDPYPVGGQAVYVGVKTVFPGGTWHMDVYDDHANGIGSLNGPIDANGWCSYPGITGPGFSFNNTDSLGNQLPSTFYQLAMSIFRPGGGGGGSITNYPFIEAPWPNPINSSMCYSLVFPPVGSTGDEDMQQIMNLAFDVETAAGHPVLSPPNCSGDGCPWNIYASFNPQWTSILLNLRNLNCRDFFYLGDGSATSLGTWSGGIAGITNFMGVITNNLADPLSATNYHAFRFVFLCGCSTAAGNFPQVFGIPHKAMTTADFTLKRGIRPRAFLGWVAAKQATYFGGTPQGGLSQNFQDWTVGFWNNWGSGMSLTNAISAATINPLGNSIAGQTNGLAIFGAVDMFWQP